MRLHEVLIEAAVAGDYEAMQLAIELIGQMPVSSLTERQAAIFADINRSWDLNDNERGES